MQGTRVLSLVQEDSTCRKAAKFVHHYWSPCTLEPIICNYWTYAPSPQEKPPQWEACTPQLETSPCFPGGSAVKNPPLMQEMLETWVRFLGQDDPLEEGMATHPSILAWRIPWTQEPGGPQSMWKQRVGHDWSDWARMPQMEKAHTEQQRPSAAKIINSKKKKRSSNMKSVKMLCQPQSPVKLMIGYSWGHASQGPKQGSHWLLESSCIFLSW